MRAWVAQEFGDPSEIMVIADVEIPVPGPDDVLVRVQTATVNNNDLDAIYGRWASLPVPAPFVPGLEVSGRVESAGENAQAWVGKRVIGMPRGCHGGYAEYAALPSTMTFEIPDELSKEDAAGIFWPFHLAWLGLFTRAQLKAGETVLIHSAAGGAGSAAVQLAKSVGATVIATVSSDNKREICHALGADTVINYQSEDLVDSVLAANGGRGVDVCFDGTGGNLTEPTWRTLGFGARHVIFGFSSGIEQTDGRPVLLRDMIFGNFSLMGALLTYVDQGGLDSTGMQLKDSSLNLSSRADGEAVQEQLLKLLARGAIRTVIDRVIPFAELPDALAAFERREVCGRIVVTLD